MKICPLTGSAEGKPFCKILLTKTCIIAAAKRVIFVPSLTFSVEVAFSVLSVLRTSSPLPLRAAPLQVFSKIWAFSLLFYFYFFIFHFLYNSSFLFFSFFSPLIPLIQSFWGPSYWAPLISTLQTVKTLSQLLSQSHLISSAPEGVIFYKYISTGTQPFRVNPGISHYMGLLDFNFLKSPPRSAPSVLGPFMRGLFVTPSPWPLAIILSELSQLCAGK
jgi:hypothetical protein